MKSRFFYGVAWPCRSLLALVLLLSHGACSSSQAQLQQHANKSIQRTNAASKTPQEQGNNKPATSTLTLKGRLTESWQAPLLLETLHLAAVEQNGSLRPLSQVTLHLISDTEMLWSNLPAPLPAVLLLITEQQGQQLHQVLFTEDQIGPATLAVQPFSQDTEMLSQAVMLGLKQALWQHPSDVKRLALWLHPGLGQWFAEQAASEQALLAWLQLSMHAQQVFEQTLMMPLLGISQRQIATAEHMVAGMRAHRSYGLSLAPSAEVAANIQEDEQDTLLLAYGLAGIAPMPLSIGLGAVRWAIRLKVAALPPHWAMFFGQEIDRMLGFSMHRALQQYVGQQSLTATERTKSARAQAFLLATLATGERQHVSKMLCLVQESNVRALEEVALTAGLTPNQWHHLVRFVGNQVQDHRHTLAELIGDPNKPALVSHVNRAMEDLIAVIVAQIDTISTNSAVQHIGQIRHLAMVLLMMRLGCADMEVAHKVHVAMPQP